MIGLEIKGVDFSYSNGLVLDGIDIDVASGDMVGLLGPNGSGKSTLIKIASGILRPKRGIVRVDGKPLRRLNRKSIARQIAVVPQQFNLPFAFTVEEVVILGRIPFLRPLDEENKVDRQIAERAMDLVEISHLKKRRFSELSGGEKQRVILAMALAQEPKILLLDEPTAHLDINHQVHILELVKNLNVSQGLTVLAALHDLNLAAMYFKRIMLLKSGRIVTAGTPEEVLTESLIEDTFGTAVVVNTHPVTGGPHVIIKPIGTTSNLKSQISKPQLKT